MGWNEHKGLVGKCFCLKDVFGKRKSSPPKTSRHRRMIRSGGLAINTALTTCMERQIELGQMFYEMWFQAQPWNAGRVCVFGDWSILSSPRLFANVSRPAHFLSWTIVHLIRNRASPSVVSMCHWHFGRVAEQFDRQRCNVVNNISTMSLSLVARSGFHFGCSRVC